MINPTAVTVDIPPHNEVFADYHHDLGEKKAENIRRNGARIVDGPQTLAVPTTNGMMQIPNVIINVGSRSPSRSRRSQSRGRSRSRRTWSSSPPRSPSTHSHGPFPTIADWLATMQASPDIQFSGWDGLRQKFQQEFSLEMTLDLLGSFTRPEIIDGFKLNMMERAIIFTNLAKAGRNHGFKVMSK